MAELTQVVTESLGAALKTYAARVHEWAEPLSDAQFWKKPYPYGNSFGHLVLHLTGNLNYFVGTQIAGTGYVRDREREFTETTKRPKTEVLADFDRAVKMVPKALETQTAESLAEPFEAERASFDSRLALLIHCISHVNHHLGQMIYLEKELTRAR